MDNSILNSQQQARVLFDTLMTRINTAIPGVIQDFDPVTQTCSVTPAIQARTYINGQTAEVTLPTLQLIPLSFPYGTVSGLSLTFPVKAGDSCLLIFSQRCIDNWYQNGGIQPPEEGAIGARHHDLNDGFAIWCGGPLPHALGDWNSDALELRNKDRSVRISVSDSGVVVDGSTEFKGKVTFDKDVLFKANITDKNGVEHTAHKHIAVKTGPDQSGKPI